MTTSYRPRVLFVALVWMLIALPAIAQDDTERENLTDIREINVIVEDLAEDAEAAGLNRETLEVAIDRRLSERDIPLGNGRDAGDLYVNVATFQGTTGLYAYCVRIAVQQLVTIEGNQLRSIADTWDLSSVGTVGAGNLADVQTVVLQIVEAFIEDYLSVNDVGRG